MSLARRESNPAGQRRETMEDRERSGATIAGRLGNVNCPAEAPYGTVCRLCGHRATEAEPVIEVPAQILRGVSLPAMPLCADDSLCLERFLAARTIEHHTRDAWLEVPR